MRFIGIDLAFGQNNASGLCVLDEDGRMVKSGYLRSDLEIVEFVVQEAHSNGNVIVVDAPLICVNTSGQRPCERLVGRLYGKFDASCHSSNTRNMAGQRGPKLVDLLKNKLPVSIQHDASQMSAEAWPVVETYPHPGHIELFGLSRILKYKKGRVGDKRGGLRQYATLLKGLLDWDPPIKVETVPFLNNDPEHLRGKALKRQEDLLDSLFCAYTAAHLWHHRGDQSWWQVVKAASSPDFITIPLSQHGQEPR